MKTMRTDLLYTFLSQHQFEAHDGTLHPVWLLRNWNMPMTPHWRVEIYGDAYVIANPSPGVYQWWVAGNKQTTMKTSRSRDRLYACLSAAYAHWQKAHPLVDQPPLFGG